MTRVRMVADRTGGRYDGQDWPVPPGEFDVPAGEAKALIAAGDAEAVEPKAAKAPDPAPDPSAKPAAKAPAGK